MRKVYTILFLVYFGLALKAAPARPGKVTLTQPDGTTIIVELRGDEHFHYYADAQNRMLIQDRAGYYQVATAEQIAQKQANNAKSTRCADHPSVIPGVFPTTGTVKGLVILVQYPDVPFTVDNPKEVFGDLVNQQNYDGGLATGSVRDFFNDQSLGKFDPVFEVTEPVTLSQNMYYYGGISGGDNVNAMIEEACFLANRTQNIDFSEFDNNNDGFVDFIYVIYSGYGRAQGGPVGSVWPQASSLEYYTFKAFDGVYLGRYACSSELRGNSSTETDGIGTFCHEFGHILGLPDIYDVAYSGFNGMSHYDIMDIGLYNNNARTPAGMTAMDRYSIGWLEPRILEPRQEPYQLDAFETTNEAYFMVSAHDPNEYFTFENRQPTKWDAHVPGHGLLISQIHYVPSLWASNAVNTQTSKYEHVRLVSANNETGSPLFESQDVFPSSANKTTFPAGTAKDCYWYGTEEAIPTLTNIALTDGMISFNYPTPTGVEEHVAFDATVRVYVADGTLCVENKSDGEVNVYTIGGILFHTDEAASFTLSLPVGTYVVSHKTGSKKIVVK